MSQEGVAVVDISERFPSPSASSQFEDQREEEQKKEEHDYFCDDQEEEEEGGWEEEEGAYNAPEESLNAALCSRSFDKDQKLKLFNDCYDQRHAFIPALCRSNSDLRKKLEKALTKKSIWVA